MSRIFSDGDLLSWETYSSGGAFGLPDRSKVIFHCLSDPDRRARYVEHEGDSADAERDLEGLSDVALRELLDQSIELD
ncbi:MAG: hypothetical protein GEU90_07465 [Gemmatimonas sp.]|nr:hypothetical protein [Gemmatimonas sp.]